MSPAIETRELSKRYRRVRALTECTVTVPEGRVSALVGPNGAGKTTLLRLLAGLASPAGGTASVLGAAPRQDPAFLAEIGFLAQEIPLYRRFTAEDHIRIGAHMNRRWDASLVRTRLKELRIPLDQRVGTLSGGQRAQVALALTLAKRPRLLLLDEPVAALDPLARRNFLATLTSAMADAEGGLTVVLSSHLVTDLERVCDPSSCWPGPGSSCAVTSTRCWRSTRSWSGRARTPRRSSGRTRSCRRWRRPGSPPCWSASTARSPTPPTRPRT
jgi:ABC-2 type transport system ATP-binding protein